MIKNYFLIVSFLLIVAINLVIIFNKKEKSKLALFFIAFSLLSTFFLIIMLGSQETGHWFHWLVNILLLIGITINMVWALPRVYLKQEKVSKEFLSVAQSFAAAYFIYILVLWALPKLIY